MAHVLPDNSKITPVPVERLRFTYAHEKQSWFRRQLIRSVERLSGSCDLEDLYHAWRAAGATGHPFEVAIQKLRLRLGLTGVSLDCVPRQGGLLIVANHPFGIADGLAMGWLAAQLRDHVRVLTHSLLCAAPEFQPYLLPVDFDDSPDARRKSAATRRMAVDVLKDGGVVVIFPGGSVATSNRPFVKPAAELPWHPFVTRLALTKGTTVLPVFVHGQNSLGFQIASHLSYPLRVALLFRETRRRMGGSLHMTLGAPMRAEDLSTLPRHDIADTLRRACLHLGGADPEDAFQWPRYITW
ncbi:MAG: lysophospholipid acyltransferase family protein [Pseudomonadota bacterium]